MNDRMPCDSKLNFGLVIGILSHPSDGASGRLNNSPNTSYIAASYVKFVESAGARVIPLIYNEPLHILQNVRLLVISYILSCYILTPSQFKCLHVLGCPKINVHFHF